MQEKLGRSLIAGLYAVTPDFTDTARLLASVEAALSGGVRLVQYRNKTADARLRHEQAGALREICGRRGAIMIVNDHVELAEAVDADGVHIGIDDTAIATARARLARGKIVGASCHGDLDRARLAVAQGADYVAFGSFFDSATKPGAVRAPLSILRAAQQAVAQPVVAIGGITLANARTLIDAGADAIAVISALFGTQDIAGTAREFCRLFGAIPV